MWGRRCLSWWKACRRRRICSGRGGLPGQAPEIDGVTLINDVEGDAPKRGEIRRLLITEAHDYDVMGTLLPGDEEYVPAAVPVGLISIQAAPSFVVPNVIPAR